MKRRLLLVPGAILFALASCTGGATGSTHDGPETTQDRQVPNAQATGIEVKAPLDLHIRIGDEPSFRIKGPAGILNRLHTEMQGQTLRIYSEDKITWSSHETAEAWITIPHLRMLHTAGAGDIVIDTRIDEPSVDFNLSGAVDIDIADIRTEQLDLELSGAGNVLVRAGEVGRGQFTIAGTGNIDAFALETRDADVSVAGAGRAAITASDRLDANISGTGMIRYKGRPVIEKSIAGIGSLQDANP